MFASKGATKTRSSLLVLAALLVLFQFNALFIHEWGLLHQGFDLVYDLPGESGPADSNRAVLSEGEGSKPYNVAACWTHFLLQVFSAFTAGFWATLLLAGRLSGRILAAGSPSPTPGDFCWFRVPRAPPQLLLLPT